MQPDVAADSDAPASATERVERELEDFIYTVSHDVAASLRHVTEFSRMLHRDLGEDLTPRQQGYILRTQAAGERCQAMMEQLLTYSRAQQKVLERTLVDSALLMRTAMLQLSEETHASHAEITIGQMDSVVADTALLSASFRHLLDNAIKFARPGVAPKINIAARTTACGWALRISDDGLGVAPEYREKVFRMFQRLHPEGAYPGSGVGLPLCRRIARRHGGDVRFLDQAVGACVEMIIPQRGQIQ
jgi:light-regulated signal transduction histidine kinase (bacteriophytochrome)